MVFFNFDYSCFPNVKLIFNGKVNNKELDLMFNEWLKIYNKKMNYNIIFDLTKIESPNLVFAYKMAKFIEVLRKKNPQYFKKSYIIAPNNSLLKFLVNTTFKISKPVSHVYIYWKNKQENVNRDNILEIFKKDMFKFNYISNK